MDSMGNAERVVSLVLSTALITGCIVQSTVEPTPITSPVPSGAKTPEPENTPLLYGTQIRTTDTLTPSPGEVAKTNLNPNLTSQPIDLSADVFVVGAGGEASTKFGEPKISQNGWTQEQIDKARAQAGEIHAGGQLFIQTGEGKIVYQRATGLRSDGVDYATLPDNEVPFLVTLSTLPSAINLADGHYIFLADQSKLGLAVYVNETNGKLYTVKTQFELEPSYLPAGAAVVQYQEGAVSGGIQVLLLDGEGNIQFGPNLVFQEMSVEDTPSPTSSDTGVTSEVYTFHDFETRQVSFDELQLVDYNTFKDDDLSDIEVGSDVMKKAVSVKTWGSEIVSEGLGAIMLFDRNVPEYTTWKINPDSRPLKLVRAFRTEINGKQFPGAIILTKNVDGTVTKMKVLFPSAFADPSNQKYLNILLKGETVFWGLRVMVDGSGSYIVSASIEHGSTMKYTIPEWYVSQEELTRVGDEMTEWQKTGNAPQEISSDTLLATPILW